MDHIDHIREAVAQALEKRGFDNRAFLREIREGRRDDGPYMLGALAWDERVRHANP
ncbi:hypothetical protein K426_29545 (plasmid) [Sphingobium sp. TKS]|jgi:hypothetical protein|nr:hypothetical protein K426_28740 [Sphingobium sp. TKS]AMK26799.1 hypothetical protein K426_29545 [Sphingobium sp. TKS]